MNPDYIVVDTDVFIWLSRGRKQAERFAPIVEGRRVVLSFATVAELWRGANARGYGDDSRRKLQAEVSLAAVVQPTEAITQEWARLTNEARQLGHPLGQAAQTHDAWVAATALHFGLELLTDNTKHFKGLEGLTLTGTT